jgi:hypothetical protein
VVAGGARWHHAAELYEGRVADCGKNLVGHVHGRGDRSRPDGVRLRCGAVQCRSQTKSYLRPGAASFRRWLGSGFALGPTTVSLEAIHNAGDKEPTYY